jgi:hypothetical protein
MDDHSGLGRYVGGVFPYWRFLTISNSGQFFKSIWLETNTHLHKALGPVVQRFTNNISTAKTN